MSEQLLREALTTLEDNHKWHQEYDDHGTYQGSEFCDQNEAAINKLRAALAQPAELEAVRRDAERIDARRVALSIIENLEDRRGVLDGVDDEVKQEMLDAFAGIIDSAQADQAKVGV